MDIAMRRHLFEQISPRRATVALAAGTLALATCAGIPAAAAAGHDPGFTQVDLVADTQGAAALVDPHLVNPWGLSQGPSTPVWVSDNGADVSTLVAGGGAGQQPAVNPLVVKIPGGAPTGQAFNPTTGFVLADKMPARFLFAGEDGALTAWNPQLVPNTSAVPVGSVRGASFKGMALMTHAHRPFLLLADFAHGRIDVFDGAFHQVRTAPGAFTDRALPRGYAPFDVAVLGGHVVVSYALRDPKSGDDVKGAGHGFVDVFSPAGRLLSRLARGGVLNSPWGLATAPKHFGRFSGDLLVGNFGDGRINAFDPRTGHLDGTVRRPDGRPIVIDGLWGLLPGNGTSAGTDDVWFSAGPGDERHGLLGVLRPATHR